MNIVEKHTLRSIKNNSVKSQNEPN